MRGQLRKAEIRIRAQLSEWWEGWDLPSVSKREMKRARRREGKEQCNEGDREYAEVQNDE